MSIDREHFFIDGEWVTPTTSAMIEVVDSTTEKVMGAAPAGSSDDVDRAVTAARRAFTPWSSISAERRAQYSREIAAAIAAREDEMVDCIARETGMPVAACRAIQVGVPVKVFGFAADLAETFAYEEQIANTLVVREPIGVVGAIGPWNFPLNQIAKKVAYAMAAGNTVVAKPSEVAPFSVFLLADAIEAVGLPPGVFNLVSGTGPVVGEALASHPEVDMITFTGSTSAGERVGQLASATCKKIALELGGKSASVLLADLDEDAFARAVRDTVDKCFLNSGQTCGALTRLVVPRERLGEAERAASDHVATISVGDPFDPATKLGPLVSAVQRERVTGYIQSGVDDGARLVVGGLGRPDGFEVGFYVQPTVFSDVTTEMRIANEEIFGPVLSIMPYASEREALDIANGTIYGLFGAVWSADPDHSLEFARGMRTGGVTLNGAPSNFDAPFGGYKQSGIGREYGRYGFEEFLEVKALHR